MEDVESQEFPPYASLARIHPGIKGGGFPCFTMAQSFPNPFPH